MSVTRRRTIRIAEPRANREPVAVLAATAAEAAAAAREIAPRLPGVALASGSLDRYLRSPDAPSRVVLCVTGRPVAAARRFLSRAAARLLWPAPPADIFDAVAGLREPVRRPRRLRGATARARPGALPAALLLEGPVDAARARAALRSGPREWIVESVRHVRVPPRALSALERAGVGWSALEPVELVAVCTVAPLPRGVGLPPGTPIWTREGRRRA